MAVEQVPLRGRWAARTAILAAAFVWCWVCGNRGLFPLDQSIVLDGAWRMAGGQTPFVDFTTPHGLTVMALQAEVFRLFGAGYDVYVGLAAAMNVVAAALAMVLVRRVLPDRPRLELLSGLLTAVWFYPVFGTPYSEQTAFLLSLGGLVAIVDGARRGGRARVALFALAGMLAWAAFLAKQNAGGLFLFVHAIALLRAGGRPVAMHRSAVAFCVGGLIASAAFALWLAGEDATRAFWTAYFVTPSGQLSDRIEWTDTLVQPWLGAGRGPTKLILAGCLGTVIAVLARRPRRAGASEAGILAIVLIVYQNLFNLTTANSGENGFAFLGIITALSFGAVFSDVRGPCRSVSFDRAAATLAVLLLLVRGADVGWSRKVHDSMANAVFTETIERPGWSHLRWPRELDLDHARVSFDEIRALVEWLEHDGRDFLALPDSTWLHAALERPSPQPILWFHAGLTFPADGDPGLDERVVQSLEDRGIDLLVLERQTFMGPLERRLARFPRLSATMANDFVEVESFGNFLVRERVEHSRVVGTGRERGRTPEVRSPEATDPGRRGFWSTATFAVALCEPRRK